MYYCFQYDGFHCGFLSSGFNDFVHAIALSSLKGICNIAMCSWMNGNCKLFSFNFNCLRPFADGVLATDSSPVVVASMNELKFNEWIEEHIQYCHVLLNEEWMQIPKKGKQKNMDWIKFLWELMDFFSLRFYQNPNSILLGIFENAWKGEVIWI